MAHQPGSQDMACSTDSTRAVDHRFLLVLFCLSY
jgi:hypothetical protein